LRYIYLSAGIFLAAVIASGIGIGGGVFYVPFLLRASFSYYRASTVSLFTIMVMGTTAALMYHRVGYVDWRLALLIDPLTDGCAFLSGYFSESFDERILEFLLGVVIIIGSYFMIRQTEGRKIVKKRWFHWQRRCKNEVYSVNLLLALPLTATAGFLAGLLGIGGGIFKVPLMVLLCNVPMKTAVATSSLMVGVTGATGFLGHLLKGHFDVRWGMILGCTAFLGGMVGPRISIRLNRSLLRKIFAVAILGIGLWLIVK